MAIGIKQQLGQSQRMQNVQYMSFQLQKNFHLLSASVSELRSLIFKESEENPLFEIGPEPNQESLDGIRAHAKDGYDSNKKHEALQNFLVKPETLSEHLILQLHLENLDELETELGILLLSNIDSNGFFIENPKTIAQSSPRFSSLHKEELESLLMRLIPRLQELEPFGCASRNIIESLHAQAHIIEMESEDRQVLDACITQFGILLSKKDMGDTGGVLEENFKSILEKKGMADYFALLTPYPGSGYHSSYNDAAEYIYPDAEVLINPDDRALLSVKMNTDYIPVIEVGASLLSKDTKDYDAEKMEQEWKAQVELFVEGIKYRTKILEKIILFVVSQQKEFILGHARFPTALTQKEVAVSLDLSEATVSRAKNSKYIQLPSKVIPLSLLFSRGVGAKKVTRDIVIEKIKRILHEFKAQESTISDREISEYLMHDGITIARRTVSKYRKLITV